MPAGRLGNSGGFAFVRPLSHAVSVRSLRKCAKKGTPPPTASELREWRRLLRRRVVIYQIACETYHSTATERRQALGRIQIAAQHFLKSATRQWAHKLLDRIEEADSNTRATLYQSLGFDGEAVVATKRRLRNLHSVSIYPDEAAAAAANSRFLSRASLDRINEFLAKDLFLVRAIAVLDIENVVPKGKSGRWPDPALANLVAALMPIWQTVTRRSAGLVSKDRTGEKKVCPFAEWLIGMLKNAGLPAPNDPWPVIDVVLDRSRNRKIKNTPPCTRKRKLRTLTR